MPAPLLKGVGFFASLPKVRLSVLIIERVGRLLYFLSQNLRAWLAFGLLFSSLFLEEARAASSCWNSDRTFYNCSEHSGGAVGVSAPLLGDSLDSNPANLPSEPTPFGLEVTASDRSSPVGKAKVSFATVKGFDGIGFGIGALSKGTFGSPDFAPHFLGKAETEYRASELNEKPLAGIRLGTTVVLPQLFFPDFIRLSVGGSVGLGQVSGDISPQAGAVMRISGLAFGYSENLERLSKSLPRNRISIYSGGIFVRRVYAGYSYSIMRSALNRTFTNSVGVRIPIKKWVVHGGWKFQKDHRGARDNWHRAGLLRRLSKKLSVGYDYGYFRHSHSVSMQFFF